MSNVTNTIATPRVLFFDGAITTEQPFSVSKPETKGLPKDTRGNPLIPASTIRGYLRHAGEYAIQKIMADNGKVMKVDDIYMLSVGVDTARQIKSPPKGSAHVGKSLQFRKNNPFLSLWGRWGLEGKVNIGNAVAPDKSALVLEGGGVRTHPFNKNENLYDLVSEDEKDYLADLLNADALTSLSVNEIKAEKKALMRELKSADFDERKAISEQIELLDAQIREIKDSRVGASETIQRPLEKFEAIDSGYDCSHSMRLTSPTKEELELFVWCLAMASYKPLIGGHKNLGLGEISASWEVKELAFGELKAKKIGEISFGRDGFNYEIEGVGDITDISKKIASGELDFTNFN